MIIVRDQRNKRKTYLLIDMSLPTVNRIVGALGMIKKETIKDTLQSQPIRNTKNCTLRNCSSLYYQCCCKNISKKRLKKHKHIEYNNIIFSHPRNWIETCERL